MDHRHSKRTSKRLYAKVYFNDDTYRDALTQDVSKHGVFLEMRDPQVANNTILKVVLCDSGSIFLWHTRAMVVHATNYGAGLLLEKDMPASFYTETAREGFVRAHA